MLIEFHPLSPALIQQGTHVLKILTKFKEAIIHNQGAICCNGPWLFDKQARINKIKKQLSSFNKRCSCQPLKVNHLQLILSLADFFEVTHSIVSISDGTKPRQK